MPLLNLGVERKSNLLFVNIFLNLIASITLIITSIFWIVLQEYYVATFVSFISLIAIFFVLGKKAFISFFSIFISILIISIAPLTTELSLLSFYHIGLYIFPALCFPYVVHTLFSKTQPIELNLALFTIKKYHIYYVAFVVGIVLFIMPFFLSWWAYKNWTVMPNFQSVLLLALWLCLVWLWDEMFFVNSIFSVLRGPIWFWLANFTQACIFTTFLYRIWFNSWAPIFIFPYTFLQGYMFHKTRSLLFVIGVHMIMDVIVFTSLLWLHGVIWYATFSLFF